jgi:hypothetical protein
MISYRGLDRARRVSAANHDVEDRRDDGGGSGGFQDGTIATYNTFQ